MLLRWSHCHHLPAQLYQRNAFMPLGSFRKPGIRPSLLTKSMGTLGLVCVGGLRQRLWR